MQPVPLTIPSQVAIDHEEDRNAFDYEATDFSTWSKVWHEKVYQEDSVNPDITLGEMLLMYFEWMSVHQVTALRFLLSSTPWARLDVCFAGLGCCSQSGIRTAPSSAARQYKRRLVGTVKEPPQESM